MADEIKQGQIDEEAKIAMAKQVDLGLSSEQQMRRTELNYYCEFLGVLKDLNKQLENMYQIINVAGQDKLMAYFKELNENYKQEEIRAKTKEKVAKSHKKSTK